MSFMRKFAMVGAAAVAALVLMSVVSQSTASAQAALPYQAYGSGVAAGASVQAWKGTTVVGSATADATGNWIIQIPGGSALPNDTINFTVNGVAQCQTVTFQNGGFTPPPGLTLTACPTTPPVVTATPPAATATVPAPAKTGNAGLVGSSTGSVAMVLMLGVFAAALAAGARVATNKR